MPPSLFSPDTTWTGTQIRLSEQHCGRLPGFVIGAGLGNQCGMQRRP